LSGTASAGFGLPVRIAAALCICVLLVAHLVIVAFYGDLLSAGALKTLSILVSAVRSAPSFD